jgi:chondroitin AC lyase
LLRTLGAHYAESLGQDGDWGDVDYHGAGRAEWAAVEHLRRLVVMAKAAHLNHDKGAADAALDVKVIMALKFWDDHDYQNPNWWWNQIGVPELLGEIASLVFEQLPQKEVQRVVAIMKRSDWREDGWNGANLIWATIIQIVRGCLEQNSNTIDEAYHRMYQEIKVVGPAEEGMQPDNSFHQHGEQLYSGGYGLVYADDLGRFLAYAWGTRFQIPADRMALFSSYLLDGEQWLIRGDVIDYSTVGRGITRQGLTVTPHDWSAGVIAPAGPAYSLENVISNLAKQQIPRQKEFDVFVARLRRSTDAEELVGNKQFWCSDFMVHRRNDFYTSVKMLSIRMLNAELVNGEGKKSQHLSEGVNLLYLTGDEYKDIFPVWDWEKLPGTTAIQGDLVPGEKNAISASGRTKFVGGASDGHYGLAAMDLARNNLVAKKAWFFFDEGYVCLGNGITLSNDDQHDVVTDVNQALLSGEVLTSQASEPVSNGTHVSFLSKVGWVYHDNVGYIFCPNTHISLSVGPQSGKWSDIGSGSDTAVTRPVFDLWIDHGRSPRNAAYQYIVLPGLSPSQVGARAENPTLEVLSNRDDVQVVYSRDLKLVEAAFRKPTRVVTPLGQIAIDHSCLLMVRKIDDRWQITASNPENEPLTLNVRVNGQTATIDLPGGRLAGSSVSIVIPAPPN